MRKSTLVIILSLMFVVAGHSVAFAACPICKRPEGHWGTCPEHPNNKKPEPCDICGEVDGHKVTCSKHPDYAQYNTYKFQVSIGGCAPVEEKFVGEISENIRDAIPNIRVDEEGNQYVLDLVSGGYWTWYRPGPTGGPERFYLQAADKANSNELPGLLKQGSLDVKYAIDSNKDGIADKYQATLVYKTGGEDVYQLVPDLGRKSSDRLVPGYSWGPFYVTEGNVNLQDVKPVDKEGFEFQGWKISLGETKLYDIVEVTDEVGDKWLNIEAGTKLVGRIPIKDLEGINPLPFVQIAVEGGNTYTVEAVFTEVIKEVMVQYAWSGLPAGASMKLPQMLMCKPGEVAEVASGDIEIEVDGVTYVFSGWKTEDVQVEGNKFEVPETGVSFSGVWTEKKVPVATPSVAEPEPPKTGGKPKPDRPSSGEIEVPKTELPDATGTTFGKVLPVVEEETKPVEETKEQESTRVSYGGSSGSSIYGNAPHGVSTGVKTVTQAVQKVSDVITTTFNDSPVPLAPSAILESAPVEVQERFMELVDIIDENVPLLDLPKTGDESFGFLWFVMMVTSACGFAILTISYKKEEVRNV